MTRPGCAKVFTSPWLAKGFARPGEGHTHRMIRRGRIFRPLALSKGIGRTGKTGPLWDHYRAQPGRARGAGGPSPRNAPVTSLASSLGSIFSAPEPYLPTRTCENGKVEFPDRKPVALEGVLGRKSEAEPKNENALRENVLLVLLDYKLN